MLYGDVSVRDVVIPCPHARHIREHRLHDPHGVERRTFFLFDEFRENRRHKVRNLHWRPLVDGGGVDGVLRLSRIVLGVYPPSGMFRIGNGLASPAPVELPRPCGGRQTMGLCESPQRRHRPSPDEPVPVGSEPFPLVERQVRTRHFMYAILSHGALSLLLQCFV